MRFTRVIVTFCIAQVLALCQSLENAATKELGASARPDTSLPQLPHLSMWDKVQTVQLLVCLVLTVESSLVIIRGYKILTIIMFALCTTVCALCLHDTDIVFTL